MLVIRFQKVNQNNTF